MAYRPCANAGRTHPVSLSASSMECGRRALLTGTRLTRCLREGSIGKEVGAYARVSR
jgi:hypothetical protein